MLNYLKPGERLMSTQISIQIERTETGYLAYSPEVAGSQVQDDTFESVMDALKPIFSNYLRTRENQSDATTDRPIWEIAQEITSDMTEAEIRQLPSDGAEQHDHYIYGISKRTS
jgi:predicted RNase H-like HicB family nuclease